MQPEHHGLNSRQELFLELFVGTLLYAVVLGFYNDYTSLVYAKSFSTIFFAAAVLEALTYMALRLKGNIVRWLKRHEGFGYRLLTFLCVWFVMFTSKFVFVWVLDLIFGSYIAITGFFGILLVVASVTILQKLAETALRMLGKPNKT